MLGENSLKSLFATLLLTATLILSGVINGCSNINPTDPPPNGTSSNPGGSTYKPKRPVTFAEISTKLQSLGLENKGSGVFRAFIVEPDGALSLMGSLQVHLKREDNKPAYLTNHQVESVEFMVYTAGLTLNSENKPIVEFSGFGDQKWIVENKWIVEGGNQLIDKFWEAIKIWNELRYSGNSEELEAEIIKGIVASNNGDGEVTSLLGDSSLNGYLSTKQLTPFGFIHVATTGNFAFGGVYVSF